MRRWCCPSRRVFADRGLVASRARISRRSGAGRLLSQWRVACALGALLLATACGGSGSSMDASPPTTTGARAAAAQSAEAAARKESIAAYNAMWADMAAAAETADYQSPRLAEHADGEALSQLVRGLYANKQHGIVAKGDPATNPKVTSSTPSGSPTSVAIVDCFDDSRWLNYLASTGALQNDVAGGSHATTATVSRSDGAWKVTELAVGAVGTC